MFCSHFIPIISGVERQVAKLTVGLGTAYCRVKLFTTRIDPNSRDTEESNGVVIERFPITDLSRRYTVPGVAVFNLSYIVWQIAWALWLRAKGA